MTPRKLTNTNFLEFTDQRSTTIALVPLADSQTPRVGERVFVCDTNEAEATYEVTCVTYYYGKRYLPDDPHNGLLKVTATVKKVGRNTPP